MIHAELTVAALVRRDSRYLVVEEDVHGQRVINQPAGHVEPHETIFEAAIRETREESAWRFWPSGFIGIYYWPHDDGRTTLRVALTGEVDGYTPEQPLDDGIIAAHWLTRAELAARSDLRSALVLQSIDDYERFDVMPLDRVRHMMGRA